MTKSNFSIIVAWMVIVSISTFVTLWVILDPNRPSYYNGLFLLPLTYGILSIFSLNLYRNMSNNIGMAIIIVLFFIRMVISPLFLSLGNYYTRITCNVEKNTFAAVVLIIYEAIAVFFTLHYKTEKSCSVKRAEIKHEFKINAVYKTFIIITVAIFLICMQITPHVMDMYRTVFEITEENFANYEDAYVVARYSTSFVNKLSMVTGMYLSRALILLLPAFGIVQLASKKTKLRRFLARILSIVPLFFISGAIATSLIYVICLLFLYNHMFMKQNVRKKMFVLLTLGGIVVVAWWVFNADTDNFLQIFSWKMSAYFSGVNNVSGVFNLPRNLGYRIHYFLCDFTSTFPYGNTIFKTTGDTVQPFFNKYNYSVGQIPPTIGMGYYYFGAIFAPAYSMVFTKISFDAGDLLNKNVNGNPMSCIRYLIMAFYFSMGIVMYNIEITMTYYFSLILPMYILEKISCRRSEQYDT